MLDKLYIQNPWAAYGVGVVVVIAAAELGRSIGISWGRRQPQALSPDLTTLVGSALGLLALMIGFTFSIALSRFEARLSGVVSEANAIATTSLRARLLPEPHADEVKKLLHDYVQLRIYYVQLQIDLGRARPSAISFEQAIAHSNELQKELWQHAVAVSADDPRSRSVGLFIQSLNEMLDLQERRLAASRNRVPGVVFFLLYAIAFVAIGLSGYAGGLSGDRKGRIPVAIVAVMFGGVIAVVGDLDRSQGGFITVSQQAMEHLLQSMDR